jgi:peptidoglycan-N-acetylglucosamine deacetylase
LTATAVNRGSATSNEHAQVSQGRRGVRTVSDGELVSERTLSLTFDDGPDAWWTRRVLDALSAADARATFFMVGERLRAAPDAGLAVLDAGHEVQLHCDRHVRHSELSEAQIDRDTRAGLATLATIGVRPTLWRTPWGVRTQASERVARDHRLRLVDWTIDTHDWRGDLPAAMLAAARARLASQAVVLMHDALGPGARRVGCENTLALIEPLLSIAHEDGFAVVTLGEMDPSVEHAGLPDGRAR